MKDIPVSPRIIEIKRKRRARNLRIAGLLFILFLAIVFALGYFSFNKRVTINEVKVDGTHVVDGEDVVFVTNEVISGRYFYIFSRANSFIYPKKEIYNELKKKFPRIENLSISKINLNSLNINISERMGEYLYCGPTIPKEKKEVGENCYFINNDGFIFDKAPYFSGNIYFKYYLDVLGNDSGYVGVEMMKQERFQELERFIDGIRSLGLKPIFLEVDKDGIINLYLESDNEISYPKIIFKEDSNLEIILENFSLAMGKKEFANEIKSKYNSLLYIDLRFKNKVLYKFQ